VHRSRGARNVKFRRDWKAALRRRALLALLASALLPTSIAHAQDNAALNDAAKDTVTAFLKALRNEDMEEAMTFVAAPFVAEDAQIFATEAEVKAYLSDMCLQLPAAEMPNEVLAMLDYDQSRAATGRGGISRGVLLVKVNGGKPVVGVGTR
jgi:hypothetical protein